MARKKYSDNFLRDYNFYLSNIDVFSFIGSNISDMRPKDGDTEVKKCFYIFDSQGKIEPCEDPELFLKILTFKKGLNFWIKYWAEGYYDMVIPMEEYLSMLKGDVPDWVGTALYNQIEIQHGYVARFNHFN